MEAVIGVKAIMIVLTLTYPSASNYQHGASTQTMIETTMATCRAAQKQLQKQLDETTIIEEPGAVHGVWVKRVVDCIPIT